MTDLSSEFDAIIGMDEEGLASLAQKHAALRTLSGKVEAEKKLLAKELMRQLESMGVDSVKAGGQRIGTRTVTYFGIAEGDTPEARKANVAALKEFIHQVAPEADVPASTNIKRAITAWLDQDASRTVDDLPSCIHKSERVSLTNARVS